MKKGNFHTELADSFRDNYAAIFRIQSSADIYPQDIDDIEYSDGDSFTSEVDPDNQDKECDDLPEE